ncbi:hypothetical protein, partial [Mycolicibacterium palauense]|uniref:hypothetical protein n=1 Tax=Mycolicibacterium palauense TaxID=2034511 RepID=UPI001C3F3675
MAEAMTARDGAGLTGPEMEEAARMDETPSTETESTSTVVSPPRYERSDHRSSRVFQALAWVGIVAGTLFIVALIFFSGFFAGRAADGCPGWRHGYSNAHMGPGGFPGGHMGWGGPCLLYPSSA